MKYMHYAPFTAIISNLYSDKFVAVYRHNSPANPKAEITTRSQLSPDKSGTAVIPVAEPH